MAAAANKAVHRATPISVATIGFFALLSEATEEFDGTVPQQRSDAYAVPDAHGELVYKPAVYLPM